MEQQDWVLRWADEFDGDALDPTKWHCDTGNGFRDPLSGEWVSGWGNEELQYYTANADNVSVRDSVLSIRALRQDLGGCSYTSARLRSRRADGTPLFAQCYGRFEFRARVPHGKGLWPALWLLPLDEHYGRWAASGEIDVMEVCGDAGHEVLGSLHYGSSFPHRELTTHRLPMPAAGSLADWHCYAVQWEPGCIRWEFDGRIWASQDFWWSCSERDAGGGRQPLGEHELNAWPAPFDRPFYIVMNVAVGGNFPGVPDAATPFPAALDVDYVRVYERRGGHRAMQPRGAGRLPWQVVGEPQQGAGDVA
jgi:beta-glucanase (GH16 family)